MSPLYFKKNQGTKIEKRTNRIIRVEGSYGPPAVVLGVEQGLEGDQLPQNPNMLELGKLRDWDHNEMVIRGVKQWTTIYGSRNVGHINLPAVEPGFGRNGCERRRKFLLEQENKTYKIEKCGIPLRNNWYYCIDSLKWRGERGRHKAHG